MSRSERAKVHENDALRALAATLPDGAVFVVDDALRYLLAEGEALAAAGFSAGSLEGKSIFEALDPELAARYEPYYRKALSGKGFEWEHYSHGRHYFSRGGPLVDADGEIYAALAVSYDITEQKQAKVALARSERLWQAVLEQMPSGVHVAEAPSGRHLFHNEEFVRLLGHEPIPSEGQADYVRYGAVHDDGTPYAPEEYPMVRALQGEEIREEEMRYRRGDGTLTILSVNAAPVRAEDGEIVRAVVTFHDIAELKRVQEALWSMNETLEERVAQGTRQVRELAAQLTLAEHAERGRIAQILHDDLQQQLYALQIQLTFLRGAAADPTLLAEIGKMEAGLETATATTRQLSMDLSPPILEGEGLVEAIGWLASRMQAQYGLKIELSAEAEDGATDNASFLVPEQDRRVLLFRTLRELLFNAVKHARVQRVGVRLRQVDDLYRIEVVDEGKGFDPDVVLGADAALAGRGLLHARERLHLIGGRLEVVSAPGSGTRVTIVVPPEEG